MGLRDSLKEREDRRSSEEEGDARQSWMTRESTTGWRKESTAALGTPVADWQCVLLLQFGALQQKLLKAFPRAGPRPTTTLVPARPERARKKPHSQPPPSTHMALQAQATASPSPSPSPTRGRTGSGEWPDDAEKLPIAATASPARSSDAVELVVVASTRHAAAAKYVPRRSTSHTADPNPGRGGGGGSAGWYSWNGGRTRTAAPPRHARADPPPAPPRRQQPVEAPPPPPRPRLRPPGSASSGSPFPSRPGSGSGSSFRYRPGSCSGSGSKGLFRSADQVVPNILSRKRRAAAMQRTALLARGAAAGLCLAALAVLAADTRKGWARDSYSNYTQFRYSEAVNVIGFIYSVFQFVALVELMRRNKHLIPHPKRDLFDFTMDQVLTYLLISSSSSATARVSDLIDNWGSDPFPSMANGSIAISFLAFAVFAICSLISAYNLFRRDV
ncbi:hypothetical protein BDA96_04G036300 [Sorghum bicolor]|uniref:CASP-like protein n=1 Tax=Sorghum bicolor TaxID=4558 RepID=A0A921R074_SORBI|nr:hypothetical protein BDA96_04G036300 [Sorghum bicolor]